MGENHVAQMLQKMQREGHLVSGTTRVWDLMSHLSVNELPSNKRILELDETAPLLNSLRQVLEAQVVDAPVVGTGEGGAKDVTGILGCSDITSACCLYSEDNAGAWGDQVPLETIVKDFATGTMMKLSATNKLFKVLDSTASVQEVVGHLRHDECSKVYIWDKDRSSLAKLVTLSSLIRFLLQLIKHAELPGDKTLKQMSVALKPALCADDTAPVLKALRMMHQNNSGEVAVIDRKNVLKGSISSLDLAALANKNNFAPLQLSIADFLAGKHGHAPDDAGLDPTCVPSVEAADGAEAAAAAAAAHQVAAGLGSKMRFACKVNDTVVTVLERFLRGASHQIYIVNDDEVPLGEIQINDVIGPLLEVPITLSTAPVPTG